MPLSFPKSGHSAWIAFRTNGRSIRERLVSGLKNTCNPLKTLEAPLGFFMGFRGPKGPNTTGHGFSRAETRQR